MNWIKVSEKRPIEGLSVLVIYVMPKEDWQDPLWGAAQMCKGIWHGRDYYGNDMGNDMGTMTPMFWMELEWPED